MCNHIIFWGSQDLNKNSQALELLESLRATGVKVELVDPVPLLEDIHSSPDIHTNEGERYYGLKNIKYFVNKELSLRKQ